MSVLATAISVVVSKAAVDRRYAGGLPALRREAPAETFCTDGILVRAGFDSLLEARSFVSHLRERGLRPEAGGLAADCVVIDETRGPLRRCLWVEFSRDRFGVPLCWHTAGRRGPLCAPCGRPATLELPPAAFSPRGPTRSLRCGPRAGWVRPGRPSPSRGC